MTTKKKKSVDVDGFRCKDCHLNTCETNEYYMVNKALWHQYGGRKSMLCIGCLEHRLGRELTAADFMQCPLNDMIVKGIWPASERLKARLAGFRYWLDSATINAEPEASSATIAYSGSEPASK